MIEELAEFARPVLDLPMVRRTRRNHGLEHATIHILSRRVRNLRMAGRSDADGFYLLGDAPVEAVEMAARDALRRMRAGEHDLAIHPNCGTNLVTTGFLATSAAMLSFAGSSRRDSWNRMPWAMALVMATLIIGQPLGMALQRYFTTDGDPGDMEIVRIERSVKRLSPFGGLSVVHRVTTRSS